MRQRCPFCHRPAARTIYAPRLSLWRRLRGKPRKSVRICMELRCLQLAIRWVR